MLLSQSWLFGPQRQVRNQRLGATQRIVSQCGHLNSCPLKPDVAAFKNGWIQGLKPCLQLWVWLFSMVASLLASSVQREGSFTDNARQSLKDVSYWPELGHLVSTSEPIAVAEGDGML